MRTDVASAHAESHPDTTGAGHCTSVNRARGLRTILDHQHVVVAGKTFETLGIQRVPVEMDGQDHPYRAVRAQRRVGQVEVQTA